MWFFIGIITLLGAAIFFTRWRMANEWTGKPASLGAQSYWYDVTTNKGRITQIKVGVNCDTGIAFCLKAETWIDRFFKGLGLSEEQQLNRLHFDENIYVISDDVRLSNVLKYHTTLQKQLEHIFDKQHWPHFTIKKLWCQNGRLWVTATPIGRVEQSAITQFAEPALPVLQELAQALTQKAPEHSGSKDYFIVKAAILLGISTALAVNGGVQLFRMMFMRFPVMLDNGELLRTTAMWSVIILIALLFTCIKWIGRTSRAHLVLIELLFIGGFGVFSSTYMELRDYNIEFDYAITNTYNVAIEHRYTTRCGKRNRSTCYHLRLAAWPGQSESRQLQVDADTYHRFAGQSHATITVHAGALGKRWMDEPQLN